jgi:hypothetical protein
MDPGRQGRRGDRGLVAWNIAERRDHGRIYLLAVSQPYRRG